MEGAKGEIPVRSRPSMGGFSWWKRGKVSGKILHVNSPHHAKALIHFRQSCRSSTVKVMAMNPPKFDPKLQTSLWKAWRRGVISETSLDIVPWYLRLFSPKLHHQHSARSAHDPLSECMIRD